MYMKKKGASLNDSSVVYFCYKLGTLSLNYTIGELRSRLWTHIPELYKNEEVIVCIFYYVMYLSHRVLSLGVPGLARRILWRCSRVFFVLFLKSESVGCTGWYKSLFSSLLYWGCLFNKKGFPMRQIRLLPKDPKEF